MVSRQVPAALLLGLFAGLNSCASPGGGSTSRPPTSEQGYSGPAVAIDSSTGTTHLIVLSAPTPGWSFTFDRAEGPDVFVTVRKPDPGLVYPAVMVGQKMDSTVPVGGAVRVYVRLLDFAEKAGSQAYRLAKATAR